MSWTAEIKISNTTPNKYPIKIPKGQVFENKKIGTGRQNVAAAKDYLFEVQPYSTGVYHIEVFCLNQRLSPPSGELNITNYYVNKDFLSQDDLWKIMKK